jgi:hypothetical protein
LFISMGFDQKLFDDVVGQLTSLDIDEIKKRLQPALLGYRIVSPVFEPGAFIYRARRMTSLLKKEAGIKRRDLTYPPAPIAPLGRLNRPGQSVFYASMHKQSVFFELPDLKDGDEIIVTFWKTTERMFVNNIGYTEFAFSQLGAKRTVPSWGPPALSTDTTVSLPSIPKKDVDRLLEEDDSAEIKEAFSRHFMRPVSAEESHLYKMTTAIGEMHLGEIKEYGTQFAGILYPSVRMWANGDNLALLPWYVDRHLEFRKAVHVKLKTRKETSMDVDYLDAAHSFDESGKLNWLGRLQNWTLNRPYQAAKFIGVAGPNADGDYTVGPDGVPAHWEAVDEETGEALLPS